MPPAKPPYWLINLIKTIYLKFPDEPKRRGGHLSAVLKYARREYLFQVLQEMEKQGIDITPTFAKRILTEWTGQGADWKSLLKVFGKPGRKADHKSKDFERMPDLVAQWKPLALKKRKEAVDCYQLAVSTVQKELRDDHSLRDFKPMPAREPLDSQK